MKKKLVSIVLILVLLVLTTSGCLDLISKKDTGKTYVSHPVKIQYSLSYGYNVTCAGTGEFTINYDCDIPETLIGQVTYDELNPDFKDITIAGNPMKRWNITSTGNNNYQLGINADVIAQSFLVSDISGEGALNLQEIKEQHPSIQNDFCSSQSNETTTFIDPSNQEISSTAQNIFTQTSSNNSLILAKNLFIWLKENTYYKRHGEELVQPAILTKQLGSGDCDDLSFLYISLCRSIDIPARFIRGFLIEETNGLVYAVPHCWTEVFVGGNLGNNGWIPVECAGNSSDIETELNQNFGVENAGHLRLFIDDGSDESLIGSLSGINFLYEINKISISRTEISEISSYAILESKKLVVENDHRRYQ